MQQDKKVSSYLIPFSFLFLLLTTFSGCQKSLYQDKNGVFHGTGEAEYKYENGSLMRTDYYESGKLRKSQFYKPAGTLFLTTKIDSPGQARGP